VAIKRRDPVFCSRKIHKNGGSTVKIKGSLTGLIAVALTPIEVTAAASVPSSLLN